MRLSSARTRERLAEMTEHNIDLTVCLREIREVRGFSRDDMARVLGVHVSTYEHFETGKTPMKVCHMLRLCDFYGISPNDFLGWRE